MKISNENLGSKLFDAITLGTVQGIKLAVNVGGMLLVFVAFIAFFAHCCFVWFLLLFVWLFLLFLLFF